MQSLSKIMHDTKTVLSTRSSLKDLVPEAWVLRSFMAIILVRVLAYGLELIFLANHPVSQLMAFVAILGLPFWGWLILLSAILVITGLLTRNMVLTSVGLLTCLAVWFSFSTVLVIGYFVVGSGGRFAISALCTSAIWAVFFIMQLNAIKKNGVKQ